MRKVMSGDSQPNKHQAILLNLYYALLIIVIFAVQFVGYVLTDREKSSVLSSEYEIADYSVDSLQTELPFEYTRWELAQFLRRKSSDQHFGILSDDLADMFVRQFPAFGERLKIESYKEDTQLQDAQEAEYREWYSTNHEMFDHYQDPDEPDGKYHYRRYWLDLMHGVEETITYRLGQPLQFPLRYRRSLF